MQQYHLKAIYANTRLHHINNGAGPLSLLPPLPLPTAGELVRCFLAKYKQKQDLNN